MASSRGRPAVDQFFARIPEKLASKILVGAARAAANVVADEARAQSISPEVSAAIKVTVKREDQRIVAKVQVKGPGAFLGPWLEYGTAPHLISVDPSQQAGRTIGRINRLAKEDGSSHSLVIGGKFVGATVMHPGARPHPFLRTSLDLKEGEALAAAQAHITARVGRLAKSRAAGDDE